MSKKRNSEAMPKEQNKKQNGFILPVLFGLCILVVSFVVLIIVTGYLFYSKDVGFDKLWLCYLISAVGSCLSAVIFIAGKLPLRGILAGLICSLFAVVLHSVVIELCNPGQTGGHTMIILSSILVCCLIAGILGANLNRKRR